MIEYTKIDLRKWIWAAYQMLESRKGITSVKLAKEINVSQTTAWYMVIVLNASLHRFE